MSPREEKTKDWRRNDRPGRRRKPPPPVRLTAGAVVSLKVSRFTAGAPGRRQRKVEPGTLAVVEREALHGTALYATVRVAPDGQTDPVILGSSEVVVVPIETETCPDCGAAVGVKHKSGCDVAICPTCHTQALTHGGEDHELVRSAWTGFWPGLVECRQLGFWSVGPPWRPVPAGTEGATEDLNRWAYFAQTGVDGLYAREGDT